MALSATLHITEESHVGFTAQRPRIDSQLFHLLLVGPLCHTEVSVVFN